MSVRIHRFVGNCVQAPKGAVHRRQKTDTKLSHARTYRIPKSIGVEEGPFERRELSHYNCDVTHCDERRTLAWVDHPKTSRVFEENICLLFGATHTTGTLPSEE